MRTKAQIDIEINKYLVNKEIQKIHEMINKYKRILEGRELLNLDTETILDSISKLELEVINIKNNGI